MKIFTKKVLCVLVIAFVFLSVFAGCGSSESQPNNTTPSNTTQGNVVTPSSDKPSGSPKRIIFARSEDILTLDRENSNLISTMLTTQQIYDPLIWQNEKGEIFPCLAKKWEPNDDASEWTFWLRDDVKFSDGTPFTAKDVKATYEYPKKNNVVTSKTWETLIEVEIIDDYTCKAKFTEPNGALTYTAFNTNIVKAEIIEGGPDKVANTAIGTGPWVLERWEAGVGALLTRNPYYWGDKPYFDEIEYKVILEDSTRLAAVQTGQVDIADSIAPELYDSVEQDPSIELVKVALADQQYLGTKADAPPFNNVKARQALSLCLDRQVFVDMLGGGKVATGFIPSMSLGGRGDWPNLPYDPERAKTLLQESGYNGEPIILMTFTGIYPKTMDQCEAIQAMMTAVGFNVALESYDLSTYVQRRAAGQYHVFWSGSAMLGLDPDLFMSARIVNNGQNTNYVNEEMFTWIRKGRAGVTLADRQAAYEEAVKIMMEECAPFISIYETIGSYAVTQKLDLSNKDQIFRPDRFPVFRLMRGKN